MQGEPIRGEKYVLRVFRIGEGETSHVRILTPIRKEERVPGLFTHWARGRSELCRGDGECNPAIHRGNKFWKGYLAAQLWEPSFSRWASIVLEITEGMELDLRSRVVRGSVWELSRPQFSGKKKAPAGAKWVEQLDEGKVPQGFDIRPVLQHLYHSQAVLLDHPNPLPPRILCEYSEGEAPAPIKAAKENEKPATREEVAKKLAEAKNRLKAAGLNGESLFKMPSVSG